MNNEKEIAKRLESFKTVLKKAGIKLTHQRIEIFKEIAFATDHPDADLVFRRVRGRLPTISLDTVYRTLWLLTNLGLITTFGNAHERTRFDANLDQHHHFVCTQCGRAHDFYSDDLNQLPIPSNVRAFGNISTTHVEVRGICLECAHNKKTTTEGETT